MTPSALRPWLGVILDAALTVVMVALGLDPVFDVVSANSYPAVFLLGVLHTIIVPWTLIAGLMKSADLGLFGGEKKSRLDEAFEWFFIITYAMGWMLPICAFATVRRLVPSWLFYATIFSHVAPLFGFLLMALVGLGKHIDRVAAWVAKHVGVLTLFVGAYMAMADVFMVLMRSDSRRLAPMAFVSWFIAYLPLRMFLGKLTGMKRPGWVSMIASMGFLLVRLALTGPPQR